ncbi:class I SAM-dependent methyltransferase [Neobacillus sp. D3-1R]|uniref:class I SAM-dependent methyltransferase n=1 Tax=Neobacillus sp. D3-1R TaxID=3445778 RepID=UPI003FA10C95
MLTLNGTQRLQFLYKFLQSPKQMGSVTPSSSFLVDKMLSQVQWGKIKSIAELGAGTGVFTKSIIERKNNDCRLFVYEFDSDLREKLRNHYPEVKVFKDANYLKTNAHQNGIQQFDCILSGLPFTNFPESTRRNIFQQVSELLSEEGVFIAFQYSLHMKSLLREYFDQVRILFTPFNLPPAFIYVCKKRGMSSGFRISG